LRSELLPESSRRSFSISSLRCKISAAWEFAMEDKTELFDEDAVVRLLPEKIKRAGSQLALACSWRSCGRT
jgi:hypothetical protein